MAAAVVALAAAAVPAPVLVSGPGFWSLGRLGYRFSHALRPNSDVRLSFRVPPRFRQGSGSWYGMRLHARLGLDPRFGAGAIDLAAESGTSLCAEQRVDANARAGRLLIHWYGPPGNVRLRGTASRPALLFDVDGVCTGRFQGGTQHVRVGLAAGFETPLVRWRLYGDSGVRVSRLPAQPRPPLSPRIIVRMPRAPLHVGATLPVPFALVPPPPRRVTVGTGTVGSVCRVSAMTRRRVVVRGVRRGRCILLLVAGWEHSLLTLEVDGRR